jgi:hypothetical protein
MKLHKATNFLQDSAPCHTSKWMMKFPKKNDISVLMKQLKNDHSITSLPLFIGAIKRMWVSDLPISLMKKLSHSSSRGWSCASMVAR